MAKNSPFTWKPKDIVQVTNASEGNILLELDSGPLRLDIGRTLRLTASALESKQVVALVKAGKIKVDSPKGRK